MDKIMEPTEHFEEIDVRKYWLMLKRRWTVALGVFSAIVALSAAYALSRESTYEAFGSLLVKTDRSASLVGLDVERGELQSLSQDNSPVETQIEVIHSIPIVQKTILALNLRDAEGQPLSPEDFLESLKVKNVAGTDVVQISYGSDDPKTAAAVVNKLMEAYIASNVAANQMEATAAAEFIGEQLPKVESSLRQAEQELRKFKEANKIVAVSDEAAAVVDLVSRLDEQIIQAQAQLSSLDARSSALRQQLGMDAQQAALMTTLSQSEVIQKTLSEYRDIQSQLAVEQTRYQPTHPLIANLQRQSQALQQLLRQQVAQVLGTDYSIPETELQFGALRQELTKNLVDTEVDRLSLRNQVNALYQSRAAYQQRATTLPRLAQTQADLERRIEAAQSTYETLLNRLQQVQIAEKQYVGNARIISSALVPDQPAGPSDKIYVVAGILFGSLLALAATLVLELTDRSIKTVKEARELFQYVILGIIPVVDKAGKATTIRDPERGVPQVFVRDLPFSPICDAYQMLQANLKFLNTDKLLQTIVVTSSAPAEGKSTVSANLAAAVAQMGRRVLLVDADLRSPNQHQIWGVTSLAGLSNAIVGQVEFDSVVQEVMPNLHLLTAGAIPPNPLALLDSKRMMFLMQQFSDTYDLVIFDMPSLMGTADAAVLGKATDGILLVVRPGVVDAANARAAKEFLTQSGQNVLGMVLNGVVSRDEPDSYFYHTGGKSSLPVLQAQDAALRLQTPQNQVNGAK